MKRKNFENIGKVTINEITLCDTSIGLYIPIEKMSENIRREYEKNEKHFTETVNKEHPEVDLSQYILYRDVALHMTSTTIKFVIQLQLFFGLRMRMVRQSTQNFTTHLRLKSTQRITSI